MYDAVQAGIEGTSKLHEVFQMPIAYIPIIMTSAASYEHIASWGFSYV